MTNLNDKLPKEKLLEALDSYKEKAEALLKDDEKMEGFFQRVEEKLAAIPKAGEKLAEVPVLLSMTRAYVLKEYEAVTTETIVAVVAALLYLVAPVDLIPDAVPVMGLADDVGVLALVLHFIEAELDKYKSWQKVSGRR